MKPPRFEYDWLLAALISASAERVAAGQAEFRPLGGFSGSALMAGAQAVSGDGHTVVGSAYTPAGIPRAARWTQETGWVDLGVPMNIEYGNPQTATACSTDGRAIVGYIVSDPPGADYGFYWTSTGGAALMGFPLPTSDAYGVADGLQMAVGSADLDYGEVATWRPATGWTSINSARGAANAVTPNGSVIVGWTIGPYAFRWTQATGIVQLSTQHSMARAVSADGTTVVGCLGCSNPTSRAFRWTAATGVIDIGDIAGGTSQLSADAVSGDGSRVVGGAATAVGAEATIHEAAYGMQRLATVLRARAGLGPQFIGWTLQYATGISHDGTVIVGFGTHPGAPNGEAFRAVLPRCPGDYNRDGMFTPSDVAAFVAAWLDSLVQGNDWGDFNLDGLVTPSDVANFVQAWFAAVTGQCT